MKVATKLRDIAVDQRLIIEIGVNLDSISSRLRVYGNSGRKLHRASGGVFLVHIDGPTSLGIVRNVYEIVVYATRVRVFPREEFWKTPIHPLQLWRGTVEVDNHAALVGIPGISSTVLHGSPDVPNVIFDPLSLVIMPTENKR